MAITKVYNVGEYCMNKDIIHAKNERCMPQLKRIQLLIKSAKLLF